MILECVEPFGNFVPGDQLEVPKGAVYDRNYFKLADDEQPEPKKGEK